MHRTEIEALCPLSGIGRPPSTWNKCDSGCAWIYPYTNECAPLRIVDALEDSMAY